MRQLKKENLDKIDKYANDEPERHLELMIEDYIEEINITTPEIRSRLKKFAISFDAEFPILEKPSERGISISNVWLLIDVPLKLYALNFVGPALVELHGALESYVKGDVVSQLAKESKEEFVEELISKKTLVEQILILHKLKILDKKDLRFVQKLQRLRNGVAHKNKKIIEK